MSIINNAHPGSQIRLICLIDRVLNRRSVKRPIPLQELMEVCRPANLPKTETGQKRFKENLEFWLEEGLWQKDDTGILQKDASTREQDLPSRVLNVCINQNQNKSILEGNRIEPFLRSISILLVQDPLTFQGQMRGAPRHLISGEDVEDAIKSMVPSLHINASNEGKTLLEWGEFTGFLEPFANGKIVDPTRAISPFLPEIFSETESFSIREFISALSQKLPMLDTGRYRRETESLMEKNGWNAPLENRVSASLSHALLRLRAEYRIVLDQPSDDISSMILTKTNGEDFPVGRVRYRGDR